MKALVFALAALSVLIATATFIAASAERDGWQSVFSWSVK